MCETLTEDQIKEYRQAFDIIDKNGDGLITVDDLDSLLRSAGQSPTEGELNDMLRQADADGSGSIDFPEFLATMHKLISRSDIEEHIEEAFKIFDRDGDGYITPDELAEFLKNMDFDDAPETVRKLINEGCSSRTGKISFEEFREMALKKP